jgi:heme/copper-type cytochrome/quinol oxidase subunit 1
MTLNKNYIAYWIFVPIIMVFGLIFNSSVDIVVHDTYFATDRIQISILISIFLLASGLGYFIFRKNGVNKKLSKAHNWLTIIGIMMIITLATIRYLMEANESNQEFIEYRNLEASIKIAMGQLLGVGLIVIGFLVYFLNILLTVIK